MLSGPHGFIRPCMKDAKQIGSISFVSYCYKTKQGMFILDYRTLNVQVHSEFVRGRKTSVYSVKYYLFNFFEVYM